MTAKTEELLEAWGAFFIAHALAVQSIEKSLREQAALSLDEYDVLLSISRADGGKIRYAELAKITVFTRSGITRIAGRLEKQGLLERIQCPQDRRGAFAILTQKGKETMRETWKLYSKEILALFDPCFDLSEARAFKRSLEKIIEKVRKAPLVQISNKR